MVSASCITTMPKTLQTSRGCGNAVQLRPPASEWGAGSAHRHARARPGSGATGRGSQAPARCCNTYCLTPHNAAVPCSRQAPAAWPHPHPGDSPSAGRRWPNTVATSAPMATPSLPARGPTHSPRPRQAGQLLVGGPASPDAPRRHRRGFKQLYGHAAVAPQHFVHPEAERRPRGPGRRRSRLRQQRNACTQWERRVARLAFSSDRLPCSGSVDDCL